MTPTSLQRKPYAAPLRFDGAPIVPEQLVLSVIVRRRAGKLYAVVVDKAGDATVLKLASEAVRDALAKRQASRRAGSRGARP